MGVHGLWQLLQTAGKPVTLESLEGKVLAVDVSIWLNKAAKGMRDKYGNPVHNAHLIVIFQRLCKLMFYKVRPIFVFDGGVPELKKKTIAARREQKLIAGGKELKARRKILHNYLKGKAIETVTGRKGPKVSNSAAKSEGKDLFELPPLAAANQFESSSDSEDDVDVEAEWISGMKSEKVEKMFREIGSVDVDAEEFKSLPSEIQHEILMEMKDSYRRRYNRRKTQEMPDEAHDFSDFQLMNLFRRGKITKKIDDVRKQMKTKSSGQIADLEDGRLQQKNVKSLEANRIVSEDKHHYILLKKEGGKRGNVLFETDLESDRLEIYEGIKRNDNFERLEREPAQFNSSSLDQSDVVILTSDSADDSDFDEEFSVSEARKFTTVQETAMQDKTSKTNASYRRPDAKDESSKVNTIGQRREVEDQFFMVNKVDQVADVKGESCIGTLGNFSTHIESNIVDDSSQSSKRRKIVLSSSEDSLEDLSSKRADGEDIVEYNRQRKEDPSNKNAILNNCDVDNDSEKDASRIKEHSDAQVMGNVEAIKESPVQACVTPIDLDGNETKSEARSISEAVGAVLSGEGASSNQMPGNFESSSLEGGFGGSEVDQHHRDVDTCKLESLELDAGVDDGAMRERQNDNGKLDDMEEGFVLREDEISAVAKPSLEDDYETYTDEFKALKDAIKNFDSAEALDEFEESLASEQKKLLKEGERQARVAASVGSEEYADVQELLRLFGVPFIKSPMEAEAQCAVLDLSDQTHGSITEDSDILLFGGRRVYKNIFNQNKYAELYTVENINHTLFLDREKMIALAYLTGSDYTEGIPGVGVITAMEILQEFGGGSMQALLNLKKWYDAVKRRSDGDIFEKESKLKAKLRLLELPKAFPSNSAWDAYINPMADYSDESFEWSKPDLDAIRLFARHKLGWNSSRTDEILLPVMKQLNTNQSQATLQRYFTATVHTANRKVSSKRLQRTVNLMRSGATGVTESESNTSALTGSKQRNSLRQSLPMPSIVTGVNLPVDTFKSMSYRKRRMPSDLDFRKRVAKSRASSRKRDNRPARPALCSNVLIPNRSTIVSRKIDLSESSSDSDA